MTDAFDRWRDLVPAVTPDADFARRLRTRLLAAAVPTAGIPRTATPTTATRTTVTPTTVTTPKDSAMTQTITPYLCAANAREAINWYRTHFRASVSNVFDDGDRIGHAELEFGGAVFYLSDEYPELGVVAPTSQGGGSSSSFVVSVADVDGIIDRAIEGGAELQRPITEGHGSRSGWILDPFGHRWNLATPIVDRSEAAAKRRPSEPYYFTLSTADLPTACAFYGAVLDWTFADPSEPGGGHITNTTFPMGLRPTVNEFSTTTPGEIEMWFIVRDFDDAVDRVRAAGGTVVELNIYDSGREAKCTDDQGVLFRLSEPAPGYDTT